MLCEPSQDDDSFSSQPDDFESSNEYQKLESSSSSSSEIDKFLNNSNMSKSLLFCLDGNSVEVLDSPTKTRKRQLDEDSPKEESSSESFKRPLLEVDAECDLTDL